MYQVLRDPLVVCLAVGSVLFTVDGMRDVGPDLRIDVRSSEVARLTSQWTGQMGRPPTETELAGLVDEYVKEEVLVREAKRLDLDANDVIIRRRLAQKIQFLTEDLAVPDDPPDADLQAYFEANIETYREPATRSFRHIYFSGTEPATQARAREAAASLDATAWRETGDAFMLRRHYVNASTREIQRDFGGRFAEAVAALSTGAWRGPVRSEYGFHLVEVTGATDSYLPEFVQARTRVLADFVTDRRKRANDEHFAALLERYNVVYPQ